MVAKIDNIDAVHQFEGILKYADAIIVLRNELAWELSPEKLMLAQKWMTQTANMASVPIFLQSQVLESQIDEPKDARLETTDISTSVMDGVDAFILSHETSIGQQPQQTTVLLAKAISEAEQVFDHEKAFQDARDVNKEEGRRVGATDMLCSTATQIALDNNVDLFICLTSTGQIAKSLARQKPEQMILCCSEFSSVVRTANMVRGVVGYKVPAYLGKCHFKSDRVCRNNGGQVDCAATEGGQGTGVLLPRQQGNDLYNRERGQKQRAGEFQDDRDRRRLTALA